MGEWRLVVVREGEGDLGFVFFFLGDQWTRAREKERVHFGVDGDDLGRGWPACDMDP